MKINKSACGYTSPEIGLIHIQPETMLCTSTSLIPGFEGASLEEMSEVEYTFTF